jgi:hypothetical protein
MRHLVHSKVDDNANMPCKVPSRFDAGQNQGPKARMGRCNSATKAKRNAPPNPPAFDLFSPFLYKGRLDRTQRPVPNLAPDFARPRKNS